VNINKGFVYKVLFLNLCKTKFEKGI